MILVVAKLLVTGTQLPARFRPLIGIVCRNLSGQILPGKPLTTTCQFKCFPFIVPDDNRATLRPFFTKNTSQFTGIDTGNRDNILFFQIIGKRLGCTEIGNDGLDIFDDKTGCLYFSGLDIFRIDTCIADMRISQGNDLPAVTGIRQNLLITCHGSVENNFAGSLT